MELARASVWMCFAMLEGFRKVGLVSKNWKTWGLEWWELAWQLTCFIAKERGDRLPSTQWLETCRLRLARKRKTPNLTNATASFVVLQLLPARMQWSFFSTILLAGVTFRFCRNAFVFTHALRMCFVLNSGKLRRKGNDVRKNCSKQQMPLPPEEPYPQ